MLYYVIVDTSPEVGHLFRYNNNNNIYNFYWLPCTSIRLFIRFGLLAGPNLTWPEVIYYTIIYCY